MAAKAPKVVFDTNIFISAMIFGGNPMEVLELARSGKIKLVTSPQILLELATKFHERFLWSEPDVEEAIEGIGLFAGIVKPTEKVAQIKNDEPDNRVLECAKEAKADFIISGDKRHVLSLKKFGKTKIVSAGEFLQVLEKKKWGLTET